MSNSPTSDDNLERSIRRTQDTISDIIECNDFDYFGTFTFSPDKLDRHDDQKVYSVMRVWLANQRRHSPQMTYLLVPERHKDGALHFHALFGRYSGSMRDSGKKWQSYPIYNVQAFKWGYTNFTRIRDKSKTANYCRKYITKALMTDKNKKRYWSSKNLATPVRVDNLELDSVINSYPVDLEKLHVFDNDYVHQTTFPLKSRASQHLD